MIDLFGHYGADFHGLNASSLEKLIEAEIIKNWNAVIINYTFTWKEKEYCEYIIELDGQRTNNFSHWVRYNCSLKGNISFCQDNEITIKYKSLYEVSAAILEHRNHRLNKTLDAWVDKNKHQFVK